MMTGWTRTDILRLSLVWAVAAGLGVAVVTRDWLPGVLPTALSLLTVAVIAGRALLRGVDPATLAEVRAAPVSAPIPETAPVAAAPLAVAPVAAAPAAEVAAPSAAAPDARPAPSQPKAMAAPGNGGADDLKQLKGVGKKLEALLHSLGVYHFHQIAGWTETEVAWMDEHLEGFRGRVTRDDWVGQARAIAAGKAVSDAARTVPGDAPTSRA